MAEHDVLIGRLKTILLAMQRASWEQALAAQALYEWRPEQELDSIIGLAYDMIVRSDSLGRLGVLLNETDQSSLDFCAIGECLVFLHHQTRDTVYLSAARSLVGYIRRTAGRSFEGLLVHREGQLWVDALYMLPPALIATGSSWNQDSLIFEGFQQLNGYEKYLRDPITGLWSQSWNIESHAIARREHLSTGNGWAIAGCVRVLSLLPKEGWQEEAAELTTKTLQTLQSVLAHQRDDGLFHFVLEDRTSFVECTSAAMYAYSIFTLQLLGILEATSPEVQAANRMVNALISKVDTVGHLRGCVLARKDGHEDNWNGRGTSAEGQAFLIMCLAAHGHLQTGKRPLTYLQVGSQENISMYEEI
jgi:rhamnogalacturonyl hydrolase YesR